MKEIGELKERIGANGDEGEMKNLTKLLNEKTLALTLNLERNRRNNRSKLEIEMIKN